MDSNKDESERCIELAERYIAEKKFDEAEKFLRKAKKLYPNNRVDDILAKVATLSKQNPKPEPESDVRRRQNANVNKENVRPASNDYTKEQLEAVKRVKKCKDYYDMLGVTKDATDSDIKKAYKKLALQLHPDKNKAPGSAEAFKVVGNAVAILIDVEKRKQYDMYGCDEERLQNHGRHSGTTHYEYARSFDDTTAEELFNMFFGGGFPQQEFYVRRNGGGRWMRQPEAQTQHSHNQQAHGYMSIVQMLPVLLLIVLTMLSSFLISDPMYSLHHSPKYTVQRTTQELKVPYYVKENFHTEFTGNFRRLERSVEEEYINYLKLTCYRENSYKESMVWKARNLGSQEMYKSARNIETPSCKKLQEMNLA